MSPDEVLENLANEEVVDRVVYTRDAPGGPRVEFEIIDRTTFTGAYPATVKEFRAGYVLPCGHNLNKERPYGGRCQGIRWRFLKRTTCFREHCKDCLVSCPVCGRAVSANCHAHEWQGQLLCKGCWMRRATWRILKNVWTFFSQPFLEGQLDDPATDGRGEPSVE